MALEFDLSWRQAEQRGFVGQLVRRIAWLDRFLFWVSGIWFIQVAGQAPRVVEAGDFTMVEFKATDYTTMAPDQFHCVKPHEPEPEPEPEPGGPITRTYLWFGPAMRHQGSYQSQATLVGTIVVENPLNVTCSVKLTLLGADDGLAVNGVEVTPLGRFYYEPYEPIFTYQFVLPKGGKFTLAAADHYGGLARFNVLAEFLP